MITFDLCYGLLPALSVWPGGCHLVLQHQAERGPGWCGFWQRSAFLLGLILLGPRSGEYQHKGSGFQVSKRSQRGIHAKPWGILCCLGPALLSTLGQTRQAGRGSPHLTPGRLKGSQRPAQSGVTKQGPISTATSTPMLEEVPREHGAFKGARLSTHHQGGGCRAWAWVQEGKRS